MKLIIIILFFYIVFPPGGFSQTFSPMMPIPPFEGVAGSSIAFADVDGDNDQDVLITGSNNFGTPISILYTNNGNGIFNEVTGTPFEGVAGSSIAFADVDGDNDKDVLITGANFGTEISKLYTNDGNGIFNEVTGTPFEGLAESSIAFADVDGDNDQDVLITGERSSLPVPQSAKLYTNDGNGTFSLATGTTFEGVDFSSIAFADVDGDNDQDVLITGLNDSATAISKLYTNDGNGTFTEVAGTPFEGVWQSSIAFADVDGDNDQDVLITGMVNNLFRIAKLYTNEGNGTFTEVAGTPFEGVWFSSVAFANIDGDNDQDVLITGNNEFGESSSLLYENTTMSVSNISIDPYVEQARVFYPNPSQSGLVYLDYYAHQNTDLTVTIFDLTGKEVLKQKNSITEGINTLGFDFSDLGHGIYIVTFNDGTSYVTRKIILP